VHDRAGRRLDDDGRLADPLAGEPLDFLAELVARVSRSLIAALFVALMVCWTIVAWGVEGAGCASASHAARVSSVTITHGLTDREWCLAS
jgi:hypothetical protein